ncbi:DUF1801 domain-containing protein [Kordia sp. YSTF-M3]|uniref:DUF1801 domain-containing protein n=1 Tax=Kordia aestuariivivens TaxID=2759037 RepID=A0ABR7Q7P8_9FLAO|nr:DUF1801 domain-containing protein [Kordia aestuariivivens]MBC8754552.1 DUF1801 domain-containing protein [Kordia aestuariivivens]
MSTPKMQENDQDVIKFIKEVASETQQTDCFTLLELMEKSTGIQPKMWGTNLIGFGKYEYTYKSGRSGTWFLTGFSPRKQNLSIYIMNGLPEETEKLEKLGKHKIGKGCLYVKQLKDIHIDVLKELITNGIERIKKDPQNTVKS